MQALLGMSHCLQLRGKPAAALEQINAVIAQQPWFLSALAEKAKLLVAMHEWEQASEVVSQLLHQEPDNMQALHLSGHTLNPLSQDMLRFSALAVLPPCTACVPLHRRCVYLWSCWWSAISTELVRTYDNTVHVKSRTQA